MFLIISYQNARVGLRDGCNDHIQSTPRSPGSGAFRHKAAPDERGLFIKGQYTSAKEGLGAFGSIEPHFEFSPLFPGWLLQYSAPDLCQTERGDKQGLIFLFSHPLNQSFRRKKLRGIANDIGVEKVARHR